MGIPLCVICCFSLQLLIFFSLCLTFITWLICVGCFALGINPESPVWDSLGFLDLGDNILPHFREVFNYYLLKYFFMVFLFVFFWDSYDLNVGAFNIVPEVSEIVLISNLFKRKYFSFLKKRSIFLCMIIWMSLYDSLTPNICFQDTFRSCVFTRSFR